MPYRYYLTQRAPSPGAQPKNFIAMEDYGTRKTLSKKNKASGELEYFKAWGHVDYEEALTKQQKEAYELKF